MNEEKDIPLLWNSSCPFWKRTLRTLLKDLFLFLVLVSKRSHKDSLPPSIPRLKSVLKMKFPLSKKISKNKNVQSVSRKEHTRGITHRDASVETNQNGLSESDLSQKNQIVGVRETEALSSSQRVTREKKNGKEKDQKEQELLLIQERIRSTNEKMDMNLVLLNKLEELYEAGGISKFVMV